MGMNIESMLYLQEKGHLSAKKNKVLDVGPQNLYNCTEAQIRAFVKRQGATVREKVLEKEAKRLEYFSTPRPGERTTFFSEIADLTAVEYCAFDVCPAPKTEILDLNFDLLPIRHRERYDVVLNFGTSEHVFNQWNCFTIIHDATKVGGIIYCVLPATGYLDHGYFCYTPVFFKDIASSNEYEIVDWFFAPAGQNIISEMGFDVRVNDDYLRSRSAGANQADDRIPCLNIHAVMRKTRTAPFCCSLEIATSHSAIDEEMARRYIGGRLDTNPRSGAPAHRSIVDSELQQIYRSNSWRLTAPLRALASTLRRIQGRYS